MGKILTIMIFLSSILCHAQPFITKCVGLNSKDSIISICVGKNNEIYAASVSKLYKSTNLGNSWEQIKTGYEDFTGFSVQNLHCDDDGTLVVMSNNRIHYLSPGSNVLNLSKFNNYQYKEVEYKFAKLYGKTAVYFGDRIEYYGKNYSDYIHFAYSDYQPWNNFEIAYLGYDSKYGIIKTYKTNFWFSNSTGLERITYFSMDEGLSWQRVDKIPNTSVKFEFYVPINDRLKLIASGSHTDFLDWKIYDSQTKMIYKTDFKGKIPQFATYKNELYLYDSYSMYYSANYGENLKEIGGEFVDKNFATGICSFAIDSVGNIYLACNNSRLSKSEDKGKTWKDISVFRNSSKDLSRFRRVNDKIYAISVGDGIYYSDNSGTNWQKIITASTNHLPNAYDINNKGEIVYSVLDSIFYSPNLGVNWYYVENANLDNANVNYLRIFNSGKIFYYANKSHISQKYDLAFSLLNEEIVELHELADSTFIGRNKEEYFGFDKNINNKKSMNILCEPLNNFEMFVSKSGDIYLPKSHGLYRKSLKDNSFKLINSNLLYNFSEDDAGNMFCIYFNNAAFVWSFGIVKFNPGDASFINNDAGIDASSLFDYCAFGDSKILSVNDYCNLRDFKNKNYLIINRIDTLLGNGNSFLFYVTDNNKNRVDKANIVVYNKYKSRCDTIVSDINGVFTYKTDIVFNSFDFINFVAIAQKNNFINSSPIEFTLTADTYANYYPKVGGDQYDDTSFVAGDDYIGKFYLMDANQKPTPGNIFVNNYLLNRNDTIKYSSNTWIYYTFPIPNDTKPGIYKLRCYGKSDAGLPAPYMYVYYVVDDFSEIKVDVNKNTISTNNHLNIYPNPAVDIINFNLLEPSETQETIIVSSLGKLMFEGRYSPSVNISDYAKGTYYVQIGNLFGKFVKE